MKKVVYYYEFQQTLKKINGILEKAHPKGYEVKLDKEYAPLLGTLRCPMCGGNLTASLSTKMRKKYGKEIGYYSCSRKNCKCHASTKKINQKFEDWLDCVSFHESGKEIIRSQLKKAFPILNKNGMEEIKAIKTNLSNKEKEIEQIEFNLATASDAKIRDICSR